MRTSVRTIALTLLLGATVAATPFTASAQGGGQETRDVPVAFARGTSQASYRDNIRGYQTIDYRIRAERGQRMTVRMTADNRSAYFNVLPPRGDQAVHTGSSAGNRFAGTLRESGEYRVRVYLMRNAARRGERVRFTLDVGVTGRGDGDGDGGGWPGGPGGPGGPGDDGGPDFLRVNGLGAGDVLNVRRNPNALSPVVARLRNGETVRSGGCQLSAGGRWCRVTTLGPRPLTGWANGRYLIEGRPRPTPY